MATGSNSEYSNDEKKLNELYKEGNSLLVSYKKLSKLFSDEKKKKTSSNGNLEKRKEEISKDLKFYLEFLAKREKTNLQTNTPLANKAKNQIRLVTQIRLLRTELAAIDKRMKSEKNINNIYLLDHEKVFLKSKEVLRERKIDLLDKINKLKSLLRKKLKDKFKNYIRENFDSRVFGDDPDYKFTGKHIIKFLESGPISEKAAKKSKQINDLKSLENVSDRKAQMEIEIEMVKLETVVKKMNEFENLFIDKIIKIIDKENDSDMKRKLFKVVKREKRNQDFKVILNNKGKPIEEEIVDFNKKALKEFLDSGDTYPKYKKEIARFKEIHSNLAKKHENILKKLDKLKKK
jgi:hypothetical protein